MKEMNEVTKKQLKKIGSWVLNVLFVVFFILCLFALFVTVTAKRNAHGSVEFFGHELYVVVSSSMEKCDETDVSSFQIKDIPVRSLISVETVPEDDAAAEEWYASLQVGDVLTFRYVYVTQETITHRIVEITPKESGGYIIILEGDNKNAEDGALQQRIDTSLTDSPNYVIGKVTWTNLSLGLLITALRSPWGIVGIVIVPCVVIIVLEVVRIVGMISSKKKEMLEAEQKKKDEEIAELKRQLATANEVAATAQTGMSSDMRKSTDDTQSADNGNIST